jgi:hypothetical protein
VAGREPLGADLHGGQAPGRRDGEQQHGAGGRGGAEGDGPEGASRAAFWAGHALARAGLGPPTFHAESAAQCRLARDVFGNPFRPVSLDAAWLAWREGLIVRLAEGIYEGRRFVEVPVLGLALERAGCDVPEVLDHCREQEGHVKGCWVVDLLTEKL